LPSDDSVRVDRLLNLIAGQSHFEERYDLIGELASGGMGKVFRGYDRILRRDVAIKMMNATASQTAAVRGQFLKEARVGGRLLHPNILAVFDLGVNRNGRIYYTMRLVDGASLQNGLDAVDQAVATKLIVYPLRRIVEAFVSVCNGVDYAHEHQVIHLDLKPQNVLVSHFKEVFVIDWGLARVDDKDDTEQLVDLYRDRSNEDNTASTLAGGARVVGTPGYMAPEQVQGDVSAFDRTSDVYGLGGILHFILYGEPPNRGLTSDARMAASAEQKQRRKLRQGILPWGQRVRKETYGVLEALETICLKALEPRQQDRYPTAESLVIDLNEWLAATPGPPVGF
jgi:eukaryotic-like serine/threonine-protein kinase